MSLPIIIVGAGIAGLTVALSVRNRPVLLFSKGMSSQNGSSQWAQGGIAAAWSNDDSPTLHAEDTFAAGAQVNDRAAVQLLTVNARSAIEWLIAQGVVFDTEGLSPSLALEGGHSHNRILHAGGDASGRLIMESLSKRVRELPHVEWLEDASVDGFIMSGASVCGVSGRTSSGRSQLIDASAVVLATGGIGGLFRWTSNPAECDGSGLALAIMAGAQTSDLEFIQFHPTLLSPSVAQVGGRLPLVSEAVRGAGARLIDDAGHRLMESVHPLGDLAPRDIVARTLWRSRIEGRDVFLDARDPSIGWPWRFPTIHATLKVYGIDPRRELIPITPAQHFHMGGVKVDLNGKTSVCGLYAVGEVACNGVHGANRLASNSLLEAVVFGRQLASSLGSKDEKEIKIKSDDRHLVGSYSLDEGSLLKIRKLISEALGPERDEVTLTNARNTILQDHALTRSYQGVAALEIIESARWRKDSIGAHYRRDSPNLLSRCAAPNSAAR